MLLLDLKPTLFNIEPIECSNRKEIICVVDRSGSMSGTAMRNAKEALKMFIRSLPCEDQGSTNQSRLVRTIFEKLEPHRTSSNNIAPYRADRCANQAVRGSLVKISISIFTHSEANSVRFNSPGTEL